MSFNLFKWNRALRESDLDAEATLLLFALGSRANEDGECWPSVKTICADTRLGRTTVILRLEALESQGWIQVTRTGRANVYRMVERQIAPTEPDVPVVRQTDTSSPPGNHPMSAARTPEVRQANFTSGTTQGTTNLTNQGGRAREVQKRARRKEDADIPADFDSVIRPATVRWAAVELRRDATWANDRLDAMLRQCRAHGYRYRDWLARAQTWLADDDAKEREREARLNPPGAQGHRRRQANGPLVIPGLFKTQAELPEARRLTAAEIDKALEAMR